MALTSNTDLRVAGGETLHAPLLAGQAPFQGALLGRNGAFVRALQAGDNFVGVNRTQVSTAPGVSGAITLEVTTGYMTAEVPLAGVAAANVGSALYASDDGTFTLVAGANSFVGIVLGVAATNVAVARLVSSDIARPIALGLHALATSGSYADLNMPGPLHDRTIEASAADILLDAQDSGKVINLTVTGKKVTLPAVAAGLEFAVRANADGIAIDIDPDGVETISGADFTGAAGKMRSLTGATAKAGDYIVLRAATGGWLVHHQRGIWAQES